MLHLVHATNDSLARAARAFEPPDSSCESDSLTGEDTEYSFAPSEDDIEAMIPNGILRKSYSFRFESGRFANQSVDIYGDAGSDVYEAVDADEFFGMVLIDEDAGDDVYDSETYEDDDIGESSRDGNMEVEPPSEVDWLSRKLQEQASLNAEHEEEELGKNVWARATILASEMIKARCLYPRWGDDLKIMKEAYLAEISSDQG